jgi:hypothetical protein
MHNLAFRGLRLPRLGAMRGGGGGGSSIPTIASSVYWLDATDASTISTRSVTGVDYVSEIRDRLGGTTKLVQGEGSLQPTTGTATINGLNALNFSVNDMVLTSATNFMPSADSAFVFTIRTTDDTYVLLSSGFPYLLAYASSDGTRAPYVEAGNPSTFVNGVALTPNTRVTLSAQTDDVNVTVVVRGANVSSWGALRLCDYAQPNSGVDFTGHLGEFVAMDAPTTAELNALGEYLAAKWGTAAWTTIT